MSSCKQTQRHFRSIFKPALHWFWDWAIVIGEQNLTPHVVKQDLTQVLLSASSCRCCYFNYYNTTGTTVACLLLLLKPGATLVVNAADHYTSASQTPTTCLNSYSCRTPLTCRPRCEMLTWAPDESQNTPQSTAAPAGEAPAQTSGTPLPTMQCTPVNATETVKKRGKQKAWMFPINFFFSFQTDLFPLSLRKRKKKHKKRETEAVLVLKPLKALLWHVFGSTRLYLCVCLQQEQIQQKSLREKHRMKSLLLYCWEVTRRLIWLLKQSES